MLGLRRADTVALCESLEIEVVTDPSNTDPRFTRNRVRAELIPLMNDISGRDVAPLLARYADLQGELIDGLNQAAEHIDPTDAHAIAAASPALAAAALRSWWRRETGLGYTPDAAGLGRMIGVANGTAVAAGAAVVCRRLRQRGWFLRTVHPRAADGAKERLSE